MTNDNTITLTLGDEDYDNLSILKEILGGAAGRERTDHMFHQALAFYAWWLRAAIPQQQTFTYPTYPEPDKPHKPPYQPWQVISSH
jgi:hypothetical protein